MRLVLALGALALGSLIATESPTMQMDTNNDLTQSLRREIELRFEAQSAGLRAGSLPNDSPAFRIADDFEGAQFADHFPGGVFRGGKDQWIEGTRQAYRQMSPVFDRWAIHGLRVLPRSEREAVASYEVWIIPKDEAKPIPKALFLETYRLTRDGWLLVRHHAEKVSGR
ncbi:MAG: hypothetical protein AMXMBFR81_10020 [Chthonomonas sp.]